MRSFLLLLIGLLGVLGHAQQNPVVQQSSPSTWRLYSVEAVLHILKQDKIIRESQIAYILKSKNIQESYFTIDNNYYKLVDYYPDGTSIYFQNYNAKASLASNINAMNTDFGLDLTGRNIKVGLFDTSVIYKNHAEFKNANNITLKSNQPSPTAPFSARRNYLVQQEHSTHVGGTIKASGVNPHAKGLATGVSLLSFDWNDDVYNMLNNSGEGMLLSNHSYGVAIINGDKDLIIDENLVGVYDAKAVQFDYVAYARSTYLPIIAAGNNQEYSKIIHPGGTGYNNLAGMATAKNAVVVGAAQDSKGQNRIEDLTLAPFSSYGPTRDYRVKPDIMAKGLGVYSPVTDFLLHDNHELNNNLYLAKSGTSMAAPVVTSVLALWQEWANSNLGGGLSASTLKALLTHSAHPVSPSQGGSEDLGPDARYGWGLIDAKKGVSILSNVENSLSFMIENSIRDSEKIVYVIDNSFADNEITATLAWTDPPGDYDYYAAKNGIYTNALVNDLDMRVSVNKQVYFPWALTKNMNKPVAKKMDNDVDNIEKIAPVKIPVGKSFLTLSHKNNLLDGAQQTFSLIITSKQKLSLSMISSMEDTDDDDGLPTDLEQETQTKERIELDIIPNPVLDELTILTNDETLEILEVRVFSTSGVLIAVESYRNFGKVNTAHLAKGSYIAKILTNKGVASKVFSKK